MGKIVSGMCEVCWFARAVTLWWQHEHDLTRTMCGHHSDTRGPAMRGAGWELIEDERIPDIRVSVLAGGEGFYPE